MAILEIKFPEWGVILAREGEVKDDSSFLVWVTGWR